MPSAARAVPAERVVQLPRVAQSDQVAQLIVTRDAGLNGSGLPILLNINGQEIAYFRTEETLTIPLPPGEHLVSVVPSPSFGASPRQYEVQLKPGAKTRYRISITQGGVLFQRSE
jgi:hypothetical protein